MKRYENCIFIRSGALGDFILSLPLLKELRKLYQHVCLVTHCRYLDLLPVDCQYDSFQDINGREFSALYGSVNSVSPELVTAIHGAHLYIFTKMDSTFKRNIEMLGISKWLELNSRPTIPPQVTLQFFNDSGLEVPAGLLDTPIWRRSNQFRSTLWIHPGSGSKKKNCPLDVFSDYAVSWLERNHSGQIIISFGDADHDLIEPVKVEFSKWNIFYRAVINPSLGDLKRQIQEFAAYYIGNDSGVSHLAIASGVNGTIFYRNSSPEIWRPIGNCNIIV